MTFSAVLSDLQTDAIDNHRSFHDKHGLAGKRELQPEDEARPGEGALSASASPSQGGGSGAPSLSFPPTLGTQGDAQLSSSPWTVML